jgi:hypothetical protein
MLDGDGRLSVAALTVARIQQLLRQSCSSFREYGVTRNHCYIARNIALRRATCVPGNNQR